ncbi:MAG TPA: hypothetical protein VET88_05490 [Gammaproteobacteria bacterium]|nr:hypothetical protein [Gammaproteobacteria bacterium]
MKMTKVVCASFLLLLLVACSELPQKPYIEYVPVVNGEGGINSNLEEINAASGMTVPQQERRLSDLERDFRLKPDANNRLRLALLLSVGDEPVQDRARAQALLEGIDAPTSLSSSQQGLVQLLSQFLQDEEVMFGELESCITQVSQQGRRIDELEQQQKELTSIEQNIQHRDKQLEGDNGR